MAERTYRIGEAAALLNLKTYVLRFWETEFSQLEPLRTEKGQRLYTEADLALLRRIRFLLHERGLTIEGARRMLAERQGESGMADAALTDPDMAGEDDAEADAGSASPAGSASSEDARSSATRLARQTDGWDQYLRGLLLPDEPEPQAGKGTAATPEQVPGQVPGQAYRQEHEQGSERRHAVPAGCAVSAANAAPAATAISVGRAPSGDVAHASAAAVRDVIAELESMRRLLLGRG